jgi:hypothetical protein
VTGWRYWSVTVDDLGGIQAKSQLGKVPREIHAQTYRASQEAWACAKSKVHSWTHTDTVGRTQTQLDGVAYRSDREISFSSLLVAMSRGPSTGIKTLCRKACSRMDEKKHARKARSACCRLRLVGCRRPQIPPKSPQIAQTKKTCDLEYQTYAPGGYGYFCMCHEWGVLAVL